MKYHVAIVVIAIVGLMAINSAWAGDAAKGEQVFKQYATCHTTEAGKHKVGPSLFGVVGRKAGAVEGFEYSKSMQEARITWTAKALDTYLMRPKKRVPNINMAFPGLEGAERADVIEYLETKK